MDLKKIHEFENCSQFFKEVHEFEKKMRVWKSSGIEKSSCV